MRYRTIVVDPPWDYPEGFNHCVYNHDINGRRRERHEMLPRKRVALPYQALSIEEIKGLPISELVGTDARIFLWATSRYLPTACECLVAWGFDYKQTLVWDKTPHFNPLAGGVAAIGAEFLLVGARGTPGMLSRWPTSVVRARKPRSVHSRKPDVFLDIVESVSPGPYLELFARRQRLGWDTWGNEALEHVEIPT